MACWRILVSAASAIVLGLTTAAAEVYPTRPVHLIVGLAAGGGSDLQARLIGQWLSERLGPQFVVGNRPGAGTTIGIEAGGRAPPHGDTRLFSNTGTAAAGAP